MGKLLKGALALMAVFAFNGCLFGALEADIEGALEGNENLTRASAEEVEAILAKDWDADEREGENQISLVDGVLTVTSYGVLGSTDIGSNTQEIETVGTRVFEYRAIMDEGYADFRMTEGKVCERAGKNCVRDIHGRATVQFLTHGKRSDVVAVSLQMNAQGDRNSIRPGRGVYTGIGEYIVWGWLYKR